MLKSIARLGVLFFGSSILFGGLAGSAHAAPVAANLCYRTAADFQTLAYDELSRLSLINQGGLADGGVCWWHARLQRSALYLAMYRPDLPKVSRSEGAAIINSLANMSQVVVISGYANFNEFSRDYASEILSRLESWQRSDGILKFRWIDGLKGHSALGSDTLQYIVERIHQMVGVEHHILFEKLHLPSITSHAYLIIGSRKTAPGYELDVIDSNYPTKTLTVFYQYGQTSLLRPDNTEEFIPYLDFGGDMNLISGAVQRYCGRGDPGL